MVLKHHACTTFEPKKKVEPASTTIFTLVVDAYNPNYITIEQQLLKVVSKFTCCTTDMLLYWISKDTIMWKCVVVNTCEVRCEQLRTYLHLQKMFSIEYALLPSVLDLLQALYISNQTHDQSQVFEPLHVIISQRTSHKHAYGTKYCADVGTPLCF